MRMEKYFHNKDFALTLVLKKRRRATRKWPIVFVLSFLSEIVDTHALSLQQFCVKLCHIIGLDVYRLYSGRKLKI